MKILTVNLHKGFSRYHRRYVLPELREAIKGSDADIVFLQEVMGKYSGDSLHMQNKPTESQYEFLADTTWPEYAYGQNAVYAGGHHGNAILSCFPIIHSQNHDISLDGAEKRGILHASVAIPHASRQLELVCIHLGLLNSHRNEQLRKLCRLLDEEISQDAHLIVAGDFNDWRCYAHGTLGNCADLQEVFVATEGRAARSFPARFPLLRLDRIYVRGLRATTPRVLADQPWSRLSDHAALSVEIELT